MENVRWYRAKAQHCRQQAVFHPDARSGWIAEAERWESLAEAEIATLFRDCHAVGPAEISAVVANAA